MQYTGEIIALGVACSWTVTALFAEVGSKRIGSMQLNVVRMLLSLLMLGGTLWFMTGSPFPRYASGEAWFWLCRPHFEGGGSTVRYEEMGWGRDAPGQDPHLLPSFNGVCSTPGTVHFNRSCSQQSPNGD